MSTDDYVVILDSNLDYCRLFRADNENIPDGLILWSGVGLRFGYDAMIRLNKERKPINAYYVCRTRNIWNRIVYRITKNEPEAKWEIVSIFFDFKAARQEMSKLIKKRNELELAEIDTKFRLMRRVGITSTKIPKFTKADNE